MITLGQTVDVSVTAHDQANNQTTAGLAVQAGAGGDELYQAALLLQGSVGIGDPARALIHDHLAANGGVDRVAPDGAAQAHLLGEEVARALRGTCRDLHCTILSPGFGPPFAPCSTPVRASPRSAALPAWKRNSSS